MTVLKRKHGLLYFCLGICLQLDMPLEVNAAEEQHMVQTWPAVVFEGETEKLIGFGEIEARTGFGIKPGEGMQYLLLRGALGYRLTERLSILAGYSYHPRFQPQYVSENHIFQEINYQRHFKKLVVSLRDRFEERMIQDVKGVSLRNRTKLRLRYPLGHIKTGEHARLSAVAYDEYFFSLTSTNSSDFQRGFDENRIFLGFDYRWNERFSTELGYQMQFADPHREFRSMNHVLAIKTNVKVGKVLTRYKNPDEYDEDDLGEGGD